MSQTKHTPGPRLRPCPSWRFLRVEGVWNSDSDEPTGIAGDPCGESIGVAYREKNARLIAAAPELLAALERVMAQVQSYGVSVLPSFLEDEARAAIAKARGDK